MPSGINSGNGRISSTGCVDAFMAAPQRLRLIVRSPPADYKIAAPEATSQPLVLPRLFLAWTTVSMLLKEKPKDNKAKDLNCRYTAIWEKRGANWMIVHDHLSAPLPE